MQHVNIKLPNFSYLSDEDIMSPKNTQRQDTDDSFFPRPNINDYLDNDNDVPSSLEGIEYDSQLTRDVEKMITENNTQKHTNIKKEKVKRVQHTVHRSSQSVLKPVKRHRKRARLETTPSKDEEEIVQFSPFQDEVVELIPSQKATKKRKIQLELIEDIENEPEPRKPLSNVKQEKNVKKIKAEKNVKIEPSRHSSPAKSTSPSKPFISPSYQKPSKEVLHLQEHFGKSTMQRATLYTADERVYGLQEVLVGENETEKIVKICSKCWGEADAPYKQEVVVQLEPMKVLQTTCDCFVKKNCKHACACLLKVSLEV
jgi:hypothetical protein